MHLGSAFLDEKLGCLPQSRNIEGGKLETTYFSRGQKGDFGCIGFRWVSLILGFFSLDGALIQLSFSFSD